MKQKVYVIMGYVDYEGGDCLGVFTTEGQATTAISHFRKTYEGFYDGYTIKEFNLNEKVDLSNFLF